MSGQCSCLIIAHICYVDVAVALLDDSYNWARCCLSLLACAAAPFLVDCLEMLAAPPCLAPLCPYVAACLAALPRLAAVPCIAVLVSPCLSLLVSLASLAVSLFAVACKQLPYVNTEHEHASSAGGS